MSSKKLQDYKFLNIIGSGSFSTVYKAYNDTIDDYVAVKIIDKEELKIQGDKMKLNLDFEITTMKSATKSSDPNASYLVKLIDDFEDQDKIYIILEYCPGGNLSSFIQAKAQIDEKNALRILEQIVLGLNFLHCNDLIHRDLKPHNILLKSIGSDITIRLADFGFSRKIYSQAMLNQTCGSPLYMAPEILKNLQYNLSADLWSVGLIFLEMLSGSNPFRNCTTQWELLTKIEEYKVNDSICFNTIKGLNLTNISLTLLKGLIQYSPENRLTCEQVLNIIKSGIKPQKINSIPIIHDIDIQKILSSKPPSLKGSIFPFKIPKSPELPSLDCLSSFLSKDFDPLSIDFYIKCFVILIKEIEDKELKIENIRDQLIIYIRILNYLERFLLGEIEKNKNLNEIPVVFIDYCKKYISFCETLNSFHISQNIIPSRNNPDKIIYEYFISLTLRGKTHYKKAYHLIQPLFLYSQLDSHDINIIREIIEIIFLDNE